jgi:tRNA threonylcarbamoyladenosine biosynthesis protein TsaE
MKTESFISDSVEDTWSIAEKLAEKLPPGSVLALHGDLGSGKTCFVTGIAQALGIDEPITSPTFTIINEYHGTLDLYHMDLYRISDPDELFSLGLDEYFNSKGITVAEWAERAGDLLPPTTINITFERLLAENSRKITIELPY